MSHDLSSRSHKGATLTPTGKPEFYDSISETQMETTAVNKSYSMLFDTEIHTDKGSLTMKISNCISLVDFQAGNQLRSFDAV